MSLAEQLIDQLIEKTEIGVNPVPKSITGKVLSADGSKFKGLDNQSIRVNFDKSGSTVAVEIIPENGPKKTVILDQLVYAGGPTKISLVAGTSQLIMKVTGK